MDHMYKLLGVDKITHFHRVQTLKKNIFESLKSAEVGNNNLSCTGKWPYSVLDFQYVYNVTSRHGITKFILYHCRCFPFASTRRSWWKGPQDLFSSSGKCRNTAGDSQESTRRSSGGQELGLTESTDHILTLSQYCCMEQKHGGQDKTSMKMIQTVEQGSHGGLIVPLSPDQAAQVRALTWDIVLCSWARH